MLVVAWPIFVVNTKTISGYNLVDSSLFNYEIVKWKSGDKTSHSSKPLTEGRHQLIIVFDEILIKLWFSSMKNMATLKLLINQYSKKQTSLTEGQILFPAINNHMVMFDYPKAGLH